MNSDALLARLEEDGIEHLWVLYQDYNGRSQAKTVPKSRFKSAVEKGIVFARANLNFTFEDHQAAGAIFLADSGDFLAVPDPRSYAVVPHLEKTARVHAHMWTETGDIWEGCPRGRLESLLEVYKTAGYAVQIAFEPEFTVFQKGADGSYTPVPSDMMFTAHGLEMEYPLIQTIVKRCEAMGVPITQIGREFGAGQFEGGLLHGDPITAVDRYLIYKDVVRATARELGYVATFMPKPFGHLPGNGLHMHLSLWDLAGEKDMTIGESEDAPLSPVGLNFVAGLLTHSPALAGAGSPTVNSYKRLQPGSWSPAHACWGVGNRAALVRIPGMGRRRHIEFRSGDNSCNPYLFMIALLAAGLDGISSGLAAPEPVNVDVGHLSAAEVEARGLTFIPRSVDEALNALEADSVIASALGEILHGEFLKVKRTELASYNLAVHPWERNTYLELL
ncbi:MAG: glutamine synthetase family protein [Chloroflexota bacterium]